MNRGFIFMLDAFIALIVIIAFVGTLNQFSRDYSYVQDETLYSYGRSVMNILLTHEIEVNDNYGEPNNITLIHALDTSEAEELWEDQIDPLIPRQIGYAVEYYDGDSWESFGDEYERLKQSPLKTVAVVSTVPVIISNEKITSPYVYDPYCKAEVAPGAQGANWCTISGNYQPDEFATGDNSDADVPYGTAFMRVVVQV